MQPSTEVNVVKVAYRLCQPGSETKSFSTGEGIPDEGR